MPETRSKRKDNSVTETSAKMSGKDATNGKVAGSNKQMIMVTPSKGYFNCTLFNCALRESGCRIGYEPTKNELRSSSAVDIQGHQRGGFCIVPNCTCWTFSNP